MKTSVVLSLLATLVASQALAAPTPAPRQAQASIPFVNHGGIRDWRAVGVETLYVQDRSRNWYRADLLGPCIELPFAQAIGFETRGIDRFDRFSTVRVLRGERCAVRSLVRSEAPPAKRARDRS